LGIEVALLIIVTSYFCQSVYVHFFLITDMIDTLVFGD